MKYFFLKIISIAYCYLINFINLAVQYIFEDKIFTILDYLLMSRFGSVQPPNEFVAFKTSA